MAAFEENLSPPLLPVTVNDHGAWVIVTSLLLTILTSMVVMITLVSRVRALGSLILSDWLLIGTTLLSLIQCICTILACKKGLGRHRDSLDEPEYLQYSKSLYTSQMFSILCLGVSKLSATFLILSIKPFKATRITCLAVLVIICAWTVAGTIALGVQCDVPRPWDFGNNGCVDQRTLYIGLGVGSILTDVVLVALPIALVFQVQLSTRKRITIITLFSTRIIVAPMTIVDLKMLEYFALSSDKPWDAVPVAIWTQLTLAMSLVTTCIPSLKRAMENLQSGLMAGAVSDFYELSNPEYTPEAYTSGSHTGISSESGRRLSGGPSREVGKRTIDEYLRPDYGRSKGHGFVSSVIGGRNRAARNDADEDESDSVQNLTRHGITQTIEYEIKYGRRMGSNTSRGESIC